MLLAIALNNYSSLVDMNVDLITSKHKQCQVK